jgi:hypothetical protein
MRDGGWKRGKGRRQPTEGDSGIAPWPFYLVRFLLNYLGRLFEWEDYPPEEVLTYMVWAR